MEITSLISESESVYDHHIVWGLINLAVKTAKKPAGLSFETSDVFLKTSDEMFKADGVVKINNIEICLLETSGPYGIQDRSRFGKDHVKGSLGALTFLRNILKKFYCASESTMKQLNLSVPSRKNLATLVNSGIQKPVKDSDYGIVLPAHMDDFDLERTTVPAI